MLNGSQSLRPARKNAKSIPKGTKVKFTGPAGDTQKGIVHSGPYSLSEAEIAWRADAGMTSGPVHKITSHGQIWVILTRCIRVL